MRWTRGEGYVLVQAVLMLLVFFGPRAPFGPSYPTALRIAGALLLLSGAAVLFAAVFRMGRRNLTPLPYPKAGSTLMQSGPYAVVRHPMYSAGVLAAFGWALAVGGRLTLLYAVLLFVLADFKSRREERWLCEKFAEYGEYRTRVRRLIPFLY